MMDHGPLSGIRRTSTPTQRRKEAAAMDRSIDKAKAEVLAAHIAETSERAAAHAKRTAPAPYTPEDLAAACAVRTRYGWHVVIRVNVKTVTVIGALDDFRIPKTTILEVRK